MLFLVTASRLFIVLYLCVSMLTASGSPLPASGGTPRHQLPHESRPELDVQLGHSQPRGNPPVTHAILVIDDLVVTAVWTDRAAQTQLRPEAFAKKDLNRIRDHFAWITLGKAVFKSPAGTKQALLSIELPPHKETGGKCWEYIGSALETLEARGELVEPTSIIKNFKEAKSKFRDIY
ncbi:hypothetical protein F5890DRAFT_1522244, partial [Lentinula detonsa]